MTYAEFFRLANAHVPAASPYPYQTRIAEGERWPATLEVFTGLGKTEATVLAWLYRRSQRIGAEPRRLVYVLPMRSLVEQTASRVRTMLANLEAAGLSDLPEVEVLMGGEVGSEWIGDPTASKVLIGTQDLLLSRALNRGYGLSRFQWPMAFAWLHTDALWIVDEVQLQGVGAATAAQLQGLREKLGTFGDLTRTVFVSAALQRDWIDSFDHRIDGRLEMRLDDSDLAHPGVRTIVAARKTAKRLDAYHESRLASTVIDRHRPATRTLVILNTSDRAVRVYDQIRKLDPDAPCTLLHSRFRPDDRQEHLARALEPPGDAGAIVVATQVVEAGLDFSATTVISDLAPWSSIVQRLGRCNRRGDDEHAAFFWIEPPELKAASARPYQVIDLHAAREVLVKLEGKSVAPLDLPIVEMRRESGAVLRRVDLFELFDTAPDLRGNEIDVSRFIREADDFNVHVLWRASPPEEHRPVRPEELCPVPKGDLEKLIATLKKRGNRRDLIRTNHVAATESWAAAPQRIRVGDIVWINSRIGAYSTELGFDPSSATPVAPVPVGENHDAFDCEDLTVGDDERTFIGRAVRLATHADDAAAAATVLCAGLGAVIDQRRSALVVQAARWHDAGKVHDVFQDRVRRAGAPAVGGPWAKGARTVAARSRRPHFRHELVSGLSWLAARDGQVDADLVAFLILAHHGRVRVSVQAFPGENVGEPRTIFGVQEAEDIGPTYLGAGITAPAFRVDLGLFDVGSSDGRATWADRIGALCRDESLGIFRLAYLESLVRVADWNASRLRQQFEGAAESAVA